MNPANPLILQSDRTITLEVYHPKYAQMREQLAKFAELEKSPEHLHTYRITAISIWNAAALGMQVQQIIEFLDKYSRYPIPAALLKDIQDWFGRYGMLRLIRTKGQLMLSAKSDELLQEICTHRAVAELIHELTPAGAWLEDNHRGLIKQALMNIGYPVQDEAGYKQGSRLPLGLRNVSRKKQAFALRPYQKEAAELFYLGGSARGGNGIVVLPCGAGKTIVGLQAMNLVQSFTLILTTSTVAVRQWRNEILDKTTLCAEQVGEYTGENKDVRPVTITTYQMLTYRRAKIGEFEHFHLFQSQDWGLIIYDEVHLLPAPVFRITADIQARRRLGLTATLVREDGKENEVFCLIGPKRCDVPWKLLEERGFIATARCLEVRIPLAEHCKKQYLSGTGRTKFRIASENPCKQEFLVQLLQRHKNDLVLIIGQYLTQLQQMAKVCDAPLITGRMPNGERERIYAAFREGKIRRLIVSKVGNFAVDLPDANVAIQVSGTFGSRQEEAQRLGRVLRPKSNNDVAYFYSLVTRETRDQEFAEKRQRFLTEQGYAYQIIEAQSLLAFNKESQTDGKPKDPTLCVS